MCSLHFREGQPTDQYPLPTELLKEKTDVKTAFRGSFSAKDELDNNPETDEDAEEVTFTRLLSKRPTTNFTAKRRNAIYARRKRRRWIPSADYHDQKAVTLRRRKIIQEGVFGSRIQCRFCSSRHVGTKQYFRHVRQFHLSGIAKRSDPSSHPSHSNTTKVVPISGKKVREI